MVTSELPGQPAYMIFIGVRLSIKGKILFYWVVYVCVCVCVFFPFIMDTKQVRWTYQPG